MLNLLDLPPELMTVVFNNMCGIDLATACRVCKKMNEVAMVDTIWQRRCMIEYRFSSSDGWNATYRDIYSKVLYRYGYVIGLWQRNLYPYGGLVHIKYDIGRIVGYEYLPPPYPEVHKPLIAQEIFSIEINQKGNVEISCLRGYKGPHRCKVTTKKAEVLDDFMPEENGGQNVVIKCKERSCHKHPEGDAKAYTDWVSDVFIDLEHGLYYLARQKFKFLQDHDKTYTLMPLKCPEMSQLDNIPVKPGFFKGTYSAHGNEILSLTYSAEDHEAHLTKITGDPNVPTLKVSQHIDLLRPMLLTDEQQESIETLLDIDTHDLPENEMGQTPKQKFILPTHCHNEVKDLPKFCKIRYHSKGRIAADGYQNASLSKSHCIIFDEDTIGVLWLELHSFSLYSRVMETFS